MATTTNSVIIRKAATEGKPGTSVTITSTKIEYASSSSGTTAPTSGWQSSIPSVAAGKYLWTRTTVVYSDGNSTVAYSVARMGSNGTSVEISSTSITYAVTTDNTQPDDSAFTYDSVPQVDLGSYLWCRTQVTYSNGSTTVSYAVSRVGADGDNGYMIHLAYANSADGKTDFSTTYFDGALYIGTYLSDASETNDPTDYSVYTWARLKGEPGDDGKSISISSSTVRYATSSSGTTAPSSGWQSSVPTLTEGLYLWTRVIVNYTDGTKTTSTTSYSVSYIGKSGVAGQSAYKSVVFVRSIGTPDTPSASSGSYSNPVPDGWYDGVPDGQNPVWSSSRIFTSDGKSPQTDSWSTPQKMSDTADFDVEFSSVEEPGDPTNNPSNWSNNADSATIWMATRVYSNGVWSDWEIAKIKGEAGFSPQIDHTDVTYAVTTTATQPADSAFTYTSIPSNIPQGRYLWSRTVFYYTDGTNSDPIYSVSRVGTDGRGISSVITYYQLSGTNTPPSRPTTASIDPTISFGWTTEALTPTKDKRYLWSYTRTQYSSGTTWEMSDIALISVMGEDGVSYTINLLDGTNRGLQNWDFYLSNDDGDFSPNASKTTYQNEEDAIAVSAYSSIATYPYSGVYLSFDEVLMTDVDALYPVDEGLITTGSTYTLSFNFDCAIPVTLKAQIDNNSSTNRSITTNTASVQVEAGKHSVQLTLTCPLIIATRTGDYYIRISLDPDTIIDQKIDYVAIGDLKLERGENSNPVWNTSPSDNAGISYTPNILDGTNQGCANYSFDFKNSNGTYTQSEDDEATWSNGTDSITMLATSVFTNADFPGILIPIGGQKLTQCVVRYPVNKNRIIAGEQYTISFWLRLNIATNVNIQIKNDKGTTGITDESKIVHSSGDQYITTTFTASASGSNISGDTYVYLTFTSVNSLSAAQKGIYLADLKLELGYNYRTSWTQSYADLKGAQGVQGIQGCIYRVTEWAVGFEYHNDSELTTFPRYIDIAVVMNGDGTLNSMYRCEKTHTSTSDYSPTTEISGTDSSSEHWYKLNELNPMYTPLLLADNAVIRFIQGNQLLIMDSNQNVAAGMAGSDYPIWAGSSLPEAAPFRVGIDGTFYATNAQVEGRVVSGDSAGARIVLDPDSKAIQFFNETSGNTSQMLCDEMPALSSIFTSDKNGTITLVNKSWTSSATKSSTQSKALINARQLSEDANVALHGSITLTAVSRYTSNTNANEYATYNSCAVQAQIDINVYDSEKTTKRIYHNAVVSSQAYCSATETGAGTTDTVEFSLEGVQWVVPAGIVKMSITIQAVVQGDGTASWALGSPTTLSCTYNNQFYISNYYANGFLFGKASNNYAVVYKNDSDNMNFIIENPNVGFKVTDDGVYYKPKGSTTWKSLT